MSHGEPMDAIASETHELVAAAPHEAVDPRSLRARHGTYRGVVASADLSALRPRGLGGRARDKRWVYAMISRPPWLIAWAIVDLGYAQTAFGFAHHAERGLVADVRSIPGLPALSGVRQDGVSRVDAQLRGPLGSARLRERRDERVLEMRVRHGALELRASLDLAAAAPALTAIAPVRGGIVNVTEKHALAPVRGAALVAGERVDLDGGVGGVDVTFGLLARETHWNWAFLLGEAEGGERVALNLVQGFVGAPECAAFAPDRVFSVGEGRFELPAGSAGRAERARTLAPWRVRTTDGACDLVFTPRSVHDEALDLRLVRSRFVQPIGTFTGTIRRGEQLLRLRDVPGVVEDQDVRW